MGSLNAAQCRHYEEHGYVIIPGLLTDEDMAPVRRAITRHVHEEALRAFEEKKIDRLYEDLPFDERLIAVYRSRARKSIGWNREVFRREIYDFGVHPVILDVAESLVGPELQFNGDYWVRTKLPGESVTTFPWHQDSGYYGDPTPFHILSLWIPLVDVDERNGCMQVMPGSHRWGLEAVGSNEHGHHVPLRDVESRGRAVSLPMKAGDIFAFHNLTYHCSLMNHSDRVRWSIDLRYSEIGRPLKWLWKAVLNGFIARSRSNPAQAHTWEDWAELRRQAAEQAGAPSATP